MNLQTATEAVLKQLEGKQDPDLVTCHKQWDEYGSLKGWMIECVWGDGEKKETLSFDMTSNYTRAIGNPEKIPEYIKGNHQQI